MRSSGPRHRKRSRGRRRIQSGSSSRRRTRKIRLTPDTADAGQPIQIASVSAASAFRRTVEAWMTSTVGRAAFVAATIAVCALPLVAGQAPAAQGGAAPAAQAPAAPQGRGGGGGGFGGAGNLKILLITKGHAYDREPFYQLFDQPPVGVSARWTHVEQPAAEVFFDPALAKDYDVFVFYDINGSQPDRRKPRADKTGD